MSDLTDLTALGRREAPPPDRGFLWVPMEAVDTLGLLSDDDPDYKRLGVSRVPLPTGAALLLRLLVRALGGTTHWDTFPQWFASEHGWILSTHHGHSTGFCGPTSAHTWMVKVPTLPSPEALDAGEPGMGGLRALAEVVVWVARTKRAGTTDPDKVKAIETKKGWPVWEVQGG